jgi:hypothetical protein
MNSNNSNSDINDFVTNLQALVTIEDFPSKNDILKILKEYLDKNKHRNTQYKTLIYSNKIIITFFSSELAFGFLKRINQEIYDNPFYAYTNCDLKFKKKFNLISKNHSTPSIINHSKYYKNNNNINNNKLLSSLKNNFNNKSYKNLNLLKNFSLESYYNLSTNKSNNINSYNHKHWENIYSKAGVITNDGSPYISEEQKYLKERIKDKIKWINKKGFFNFVGKASSNKSYVIKNYVSQTPSLPPILHNFRPINKSKWIIKDDFKVC